MPDADYRDCIELAGQIAASVEDYASDHLPDAIIPHLKPLIGRIQELEAEVERLRPRGSKERAAFCRKMAKALLKTSGGKK